jgi:hypothetical protein
MQKCGSVTGIALRGGHLGKKQVARIDLSSVPLPNLHHQLQIQRHQVAVRSDA